jgi:AcrR family transcriptional regulator
MAEEISGKGDPVRTLELLWGRAPPPKRGPKPRASLEEIVDTAVRVADQEGLDAVSTRRIADEVGISTMSVYTYVPSKHELFDLMLDRIYSELASGGDGDWRARLFTIAHSLFDLCVRHPWVLLFATHRPVLGPNTLAAYEHLLAAVDGVGLGEIEMDRVVTLVADYVHGAVRGAARERQVREVTGMSDDEWWRRVEPVLKTLDFSPYPVALRVGPVTGEAYGAHDPAGAFSFGLARVLDGLALFIEPRRNPAELG